MLFESIDILISKYNFSLNETCKILNVNKSSFLYWKSIGKINTYKNVSFYSEVISAYVHSNGIYGSPKITAVLNSKGIICSSSKVAKTMHLLGIRSIVSKRFPHRKSNISNDEKSLIINLIKDLEINRLNQVWTTDITYIKTINEGTFYLITYIDYFSKKVVSWGLFDNQKTDKLLVVLTMAIKKRKPLPGLICHSDKGSQMRSKVYRKFLRCHNIIFSYTSLNHSCDENAAQESFHASLKKECLYQTKIYNFEDAYKAIYDYIEGFYNPIRIHSSIGYLSPDEYEKKATLR